MSISENLKKIRLEHGLTQKQLSDKLNIGQATIACYENGQREPHIINLIAYADYFECSVDYLLGRTDDYGNIVIADSERKISVDDAERRILLKFRDLDKYEKIKLIGYLDGLSEK